MVIESSGSLMHSREFRLELWTHSLKDRFIWSVFTIDLPHVATNMEKVHMYICSLINVS